MGADNWRICPKCLAKEQAKLDKLKKRVETDYGKILPDQYLKVVADSQKKIELTETLREDYEIGMCDDAEFFVIYSCSCAKCDFSFEYRHDENVSKKREAAQ